MRRIPLLPMLSAALVLLSAYGCKKNAPQEESPVGEATAEEVPDAAADADTQQLEEEAAGAPTEEADEDTPAANMIGSLPLPEDWTAVSTQTPKGATVMLGVPSAWIEVKPPNDATLLVMGAPVGEPEAGMKITVVSKDFKGTLPAFVESTKGRLESFAEIKSEGPIKVADTEAYEFVASWETPVGNKDTVQLLVSTGQEGIGITCEVPPAELDKWRGRCDEIFATHKVHTPAKGGKP